MIWVIGSNEILGKELCSQLAKKKIPFISSDKEVDISNYDCIESFTRKQESESYLSSSFRTHDAFKIKWIINCIDVPFNDSSEEENAFKFNVNAPENLAHYARFNNIKLIHISSNQVFQANEFFYTEEMTKNTDSLYGLQKSNAEDLISQGMTQYYIIRTSNLYGYGSKNIISSLIELLNNKNNCSFSENKIVIPTFAKNVSNVILTLIERSEKNSSVFNTKDIIPYGIYNYTDQGKTTLFELAKKVYNLGIKYKKIKNECSLMADNSDENLMIWNDPVISTDKIQKELKIKIPTWEKSIDIFIKNNDFSLI